MEMNRWAPLGHAVVKTLTLAGRVMAMISAVVLVELVVSALGLELKRKAAEQATIDAEIQQEPYRGTEWGRPYWKEIAAYRETWYPYVFYRVTDCQGRFLNVKDGVRQTYHATAFPDVPRLRVFVFGGSAAWGHGSRDLETIPSWLSRTAERHGRPWDVRNYAESGWVNWQNVVYLLERLADGDRPDAVIFYSGVNELLHARQWPDLRRPVYDANFYSSALHERAMEITRPLQRLWDYYRSTSFTIRTLFSRETPTHTSSSPELARRIAHEYLTDKAVVESLGRLYGFQTFFVWQVTVADKAPLTAQERRYAGWLPLPADGTPTLAWWSMSEDVRAFRHAAGEALSGSNVIDLSSAFSAAPETAFIDWMHLSEAGNARLARALYDRLPSDLTSPPSGTPSPAR